MKNTNLHAARSLISEGRLIEAREILSTFLGSQSQNIPKSLKEALIKELEKTYPHETIDIFLDHLCERDLNFLSILHRNAGDPLPLHQKIVVQSELSKRKASIQSIRKIKSDVVEIKLSRNDLKDITVYQPFLRNSCDQNKLLYKELCIESQYETSIIVRTHDDYLPIILSQKNNIKDNCVSNLEIIYFPSLCHGGLHFSELLNAFPSLEGQAIQALAEKYINNILSIQDRVKKIIVYGDTYTGHYPINTYNFKSWLKLVFNVDTYKKHISNEASFNSNDIAITIPEDYIPTIATLTSAPIESKIDTVSRNSIGVICKHDFSPTSICYIVRHEIQNNLFLPAVLASTTSRIQKNNAIIKLNTLPHELDFIYMRNEIHRFDISKIYEFSCQNKLNSPQRLSSDPHSTINTNHKDLIGKFVLVINNLLEVADPVKCLFSLLLQENIEIDQLYLTRDESREKEFRKIIKIIENEFKHIRKSKGIPLNIIDPNLSDLFDDLQDQQVCFIDASLFLPTNSTLFQINQLVSGDPLISSIGLAVVSLRPGNSSMLNLQLNGLKCEDLSPTCMELKLHANQVDSYFAFNSLPFNVIANTPDFVIIPSKTIKKYFEHGLYSLDLEQQLLNIMIQSVLDGNINLCSPHLGVMRLTKPSKTRFYVNLYPLHQTRENIFNSLEQVTSSKRVFQ